jgi:Matrixin
MSVSSYSRASRRRLLPALAVMVGLALPATLLASAPAATASAQTATASAQTVTATLAAGGRGSATSYTLQHSGGHVVRWNPCKTIHYRVNVAHAPKGALADVRTAVKRVASATGMKFLYDGATKQIPQHTYGTTLDPTKAVPRIVVAWAAPGKGKGHSDLLSNDSREVGVGGFQAYSWSRGKTVHRLRILAGFVVISTRSNSIKGGFGKGPNRGGLLLHEFGHAVGLGHTKDKLQIMYPVLGPYATYGAGDRTGLRKVGRPAGCIS